MELAFSYENLSWENSHCLAFYSHQQRERLWVVFWWSPSLLSLCIYSFYIFLHLPFTHLHVWIYTYVSSFKLQLKNPVIVPIWRNRTITFLSLNLYTRAQQFWSAGPLKGKMYFHRVFLLGSSLELLENLYQGLDISPLTLFIPKL